MSEDFLKSYPFEIQYHLEPHRGVSGTRNACFEYSTADYVMFCDADDMFYNMCGIWFIFNEMKTPFDTMSTVFTEEVKMDDGSFVYINHAVDDSTFVHGKIHNRQYLIDNSIKWNEKLTIHEDSFFNGLCRNLTETIRYGQTPIYLWKYRDTSVCRRDKDYILKTYYMLLDSGDALLDEFIKRGRTDKVLSYLAFYIFDAYYTLNKPEWINQDNKEYRAKVEKRFAEFYKKFKGYWILCPSNLRMNTSNNIRQRCINEGMMMEAITIDDWLAKIEKMNKTKKKK